MYRLGRMAVAHPASGYGRGGGARNMKSMRPPRTVGADTGLPCRRGRQPGGTTYKFAGFSQKNSMKLRKFWSATGRPF